MAQSFERLSTAAVGRVRPPHSSKPHKGFDGCQSNRLLVAEGVFLLITCRRIGLAVH